MLEERAKVVSVDTGMVWVEADRSQGCAKCEAGEGCGGGVLTKLVKRNASRIQANNSISGIVPGDEVVIGLDEQALLRSSIMAYLVPIIGLFVGALAAEILLQANDIIVAAMGMVGLAAGFVILRGFSLKTSRNQRYQPMVLRKASGTSGGCQVYMADNQN